MSRLYSCFSFTRAPTTKGTQGRMGQYRQFWRGLRRPQSHAWIRQSPVSVQSARSLSSGVDLTLSGKHVPLQMVNWPSDLLGYCPLRCPNDPALDTQPAASQPGVLTSRQRTLHNVQPPCDKLFARQSQLFAVSDFSLRLSRFCAVPWWIVTNNSVQFSLIYCSKNDDDNNNYIEKIAYSLSNVV